MSKFFRHQFAVATVAAVAGLCAGAFAQDVFPYTDGGDEGSGPGGPGSGWVDEAVLAPMFVITEIGTLGTGVESYCTGISNTGWIVGGSKTSVGSSAATHAFRTREGAPIQDLGSLPLLAHSSAYGVNDSGDVVGVSAAAANLYGSSAQPWIWRNGAFIDLDDQHRGVYASANGINSTGWVVGTNSFLGTGSVESFKWKTGPSINLPDLTGDSCHISYGMGINDTGMIVGYSAAPGRCGDNRAVAYNSAGAVWELGTLGGANGQAQSVNNSGTIVGYSETETGQNRATLWRNGGITNLGTLSGASFAMSVNSDGNVAGYFIDAQNQQRAAVWLNGNMFDLNTLLANGGGWRLFIATGINNNGQIVGQARNPAGKLRGFVLTPPCRSDYNRDGGIDGADVSDFLNAWEQSFADTDINLDGGIDGGDVETFFGLWEAGRC